MEEENFKYSLSAYEVDYILLCLQEKPYIEVWELIEKLKSQYFNQKNNVEKDNVEKDDKGYVYFNQKNNVEKDDKGC